MGERSHGMREMRVRFPPESTSFGAGAQQGERSLRKRETRVRVPPDPPSFYGEDSAVVNTGDCDSPDAGSNPVLHPMLG